MLKEIERDRRIYQEAEKFLPSLGIRGVTSKLIRKYQSPDSLRSRPNTISDVYRRLCESAQNANMKAGVVGRSIGGIQALAPVLFHFDPARTLKDFEFDWEKLLDRIVDEVKPRGKIRRTPRSIWPQYCRSIVSGATFLSQFKSTDDFFSWVDFFDQDERARASLPLLLGREIEGFGFALGCDFLKEMGYINFPKPDIHLRHIFEGIGLCDKPKDDYHLFKSIVRLSSNAKVSPYAADKTFWLIGSGFFYDDPNIGKHGRVGSHKGEFVNYIKSTIIK